MCADQLFSVPFIPKSRSYSPKSEFFQEGNSITRLYEKQFAVELDDEKLLHNALPEFKCGKSGCSAKFDTVHAYEIHYKSFHFNICTECSREFPSQSLLDCHIEEKHDSYQKAAEIKCLNPYSCIVTTCQEKFQSVSERNEHLIKVHKYPSNYKFSDLKTKNRNDKMDTSENENIGHKLENKCYVPRVPNSICFGRNSMKSFQRGMKKQTTGKNKAPVASNKDITMKELQDAL